MVNLIISSDHDTTQGAIDISSLAIARLASHAVLQSYGIVGMAAPNVASEIAWTLTRDPNRGIEIHLNGNEISIDLYIIIEYGTRISAVAASVINAVRFSVENATKMSVVQIHVHVQGIRISDKQLR